MLLLVFYSSLALYPLFLTQLSNYSHSQNSEHSVRWLLACVGAASLDLLGKVGFEPDDKIAFPLKLERKGLGGVEMLIGKLKN